MPGRAVIFSHQHVGLSLARHALLNEAISSWRLPLARVARFTSCHSHSLTALALVASVRPFPSFAPPRATFSPVIDFGVVPHGSGIKLRGSLSKVTLLSSALTQLWRRFGDAPTAGVGKSCAGYSRVGIFECAHDRGRDAERERRRALCRPCRNSAKKCSYL